MPPTGWAAPRGKANLALIGPAVITVESASLFLLVTSLLRSIRRGSCGARCRLPVGRALVVGRGSRRGLVRERRAGLGRHVGVVS